MRYLRRCQRGWQRKDLEGNIRGSTIQFVRQEFDAPSAGAAGGVIRSGVIRLVSKCLEG